MADLIERHSAITLPVMPKEHREYQTFNLDDAYELGWFDYQKCIEELPSAQPEPFEITDEQAILHLQSTGWMQNHDREMYESGLREQLADDSGSYDSLTPSAQPELITVNIDHELTQEEYEKLRKDMANAPIMLLPSAQPTVHPQRTCVNCGRTVNNGGWYADGRTRCPIEEHYALPKDGYCHLWEKRNVTDDDYPERREE